MLEAAIVLQLALGKYLEATIIAGLLLFNAALGLFQQSRAQATLAALTSRLALNAAVRRDGAWKTLPAAALVSGDIVKLSLGGVVAADMQLLTGDAPALTFFSIGFRAGTCTTRHCGGCAAAGWVPAATRQIRFPTSSATSSAPWASSATPTGRP
jgi:H+-transporting ATPase